MNPSISQASGKPSRSDYKMALVKWESFGPPYAGSHIQSCVTAVKVILAFDGKHRRSKYEKSNYLRIDFNKKGKVTFYAEFPKKLGIKGRKLGHFPEMQLQVARNRAKEIFDGCITADTVHDAIKLFEVDIRKKCVREVLTQGTVETYLCRTKKLTQYFPAKAVFSEIHIKELEEVLDRIMDNESAQYANELYGELRRVWRFAAPKFVDGRNVARECADDYVSSRVVKTTACEIYTDLDSMAILWNNLELTSSQHQRNAMRYMIITGMRPVNIAGLKWEWFDDELHPTQILYPATEMKSGKAFAMPVTAHIRVILSEQRDWRDRNLPNCNEEYVFLMPSNPMNGFSQRSLDKLIKDHFPIDGVLGELSEQSIKGKNGAFNTLCRKFVRTHIKKIYRQIGRSLREATDIAKLCVNHTGDVDDRLSEAYDFSEELYDLKFKTILDAIQKHEKIVFERAKKLRDTDRKSGLVVRKAIAELENSERDMVRAMIVKKLGKPFYRSFIDTVMTGSSVPNSILIKTKQGRARIIECLDSL